MEVLIMQFFLRRRFIVFFCFVVWLAAAGLVCRAFLPSRLETQQPERVDPSQVVQADAVHPGVTLAQR